ncbi:ABC transporter permease [Ruminococcus sp.]|uniref:ABC transporter permease n=1 Tax=Ruminococcus sp. TaxID=41978 RepID=UPI00399AE786
MKINRLFSLELERNSLRPYQIAVEVGTVFILGFIYLMAAIPKIDPGDSDAELFSSYNFVIGLTLVVMMGIFSVISATMSSKFIVDEYRGKKAILLFSYPISRKKIMETKILLVFLFTFGSMLISGAIVLAVFMITESLVPIGNDIASLGLMLTSIIYLVCYALIRRILWYCFELDWVQKAVCYCNNSCILHYYGYNVSDSSYDIFFWSGDDIAFGWYGNYYIFSR